MGYQGHLRPPLNESQNTPKNNLRSFFCGGFSSSISCCWLFVFNVVFLSNRLFHLKKNLGGLRDFKRSEAQTWSPFFGVQHLLPGSSQDLDTWLITIVIVGPLKDRATFPLQMAFSWLINGDYKLLTNWDNPPSGQMSKLPKPEWQAAFWGLGFP